MGITVNTVPDLVLALKFFSIVTEGLSSPNTVYATVTADCNVYSQCHAIKN